MNWSRRRWSTASDKQFHDAVFAGQTYDPFSRSYPGNVTIRRFADLAGAYARPGTDILDLGCGPGEITCELARRLPGCRVTGIDHSAEAIARGQRLADQLTLTNVRFEVQDLERYEPSARVDLVTMFDAFHHVLEPAAFVERIGRATDRFFLVEPAGNRLGQWQKTLDMDWLAESIFVIRDRLEYQFNLTPALAPASSPGQAAGEPTEHRYTMEDFQRFFDGFGLDINGTIAGLERYGSLPHATSALRDAVGQSIFELVVQLETMLKRMDLDLAAKHWAIYAERGRTFPLRTVPSLRERPVAQPLTGPYDAEYGAYEGPSETRAGASVGGSVTVSNRGWRAWDSEDPKMPILVSYHWHDAKGAVVISDGVRTRLPQPIGPGEQATVAFRFECPQTPGRYALVIDLVHEHVTWFSQAGVPPLEVPIHVV